MMFFALAWSLRDDWVYSDVTTSYTNWQMPFSPHWNIGGVFLIGIGTFLVGRGHDVHLRSTHAGVLPRRDAQRGTRRPWFPTTTGCRRRWITAKPDGESD